jgi:hypothetical protein
MRTADSRVMGAQSGAESRKDPRKNMVLFPGRKGGDDTRPCSAPWTLMALARSMRQNYECGMGSSMDAMIAGIICALDSDARTASSWQFNIGQFRAGCDGVFNMPRRQGLQRCHALHNFRSSRCALDLHAFCLGPEGVRSNVSRSENQGERLFVSRSEIKETAAALAKGSRKKWKLELELVEVVVHVALVVMMRLRYNII